MNCGTYIYMLGLFLNVLCMILCFHRIKNIKILIFLSASDSLMGIKKHILRMLNKRKLNASVLRYGIYYSSIVINSAEDIRIETYNLKIYDYILFLLSERPSKNMTDEELDNLSPWSNGIGDRINEFIKSRESR